MKILFYGDSITDASRQRGGNDAGRVREEYSINPRAYGSGYVFLAATELFFEKPNYYEVLNRGIGGDRLPQIYARIQLDVWNERPDLLSILIGFNDLDTGVNPNFTDLNRWGKVYRMLISDTKEKCPDTKIIICEPFAISNNEDPFTQKRAAIACDYAREAKKIAEEFNIPFVPLQEKMDKAVSIYGIESCCYDGVHPNLVGSKIIADAWLEVFREKIIK